jgi:predicted DsbA family dithiol-disulfide isomerase
VRDFREIGNPSPPSSVVPSVNLDFYTSAFCDPCIMTRAVVEDVRRLVPAAVIRELDVARDEDEAREAGIRSTPTIIVRSDDGSEVFRAAGIPTVNQVLVALAKTV